MKKFLFRLAIFILPLLVYLLVPAYVLYRSGENFYNPDHIIASGRNYLIGYAYNDSNYRYLKWKTMATQKRRSIVVLGSSRVLQFRKNMFSTDFYNAGYAVSGVRDFKLFLQSIPKEKYPDYLLINLDQWMFNPAWDSSSGKMEKDIWRQAFNKNPDLSVLNIAWKDLFIGKYALTVKPKTANCVGLNAVVNRKGFRSDGSLDYGRQISEQMKDTVGHYDDTYNRIAEGVRRFEFSENLNPKAVSELKKLLEFCKSNEIEVVAFIPPLGDAVYKKMEASGKYRYIEKIYPTINPLFKKYGFELYNFPTVSSCGSNDNETIDGFHGGEVTALKILLKMVESGSILRKITNPEQLKSDLQHPINRYQVYK